jgi:putative ABC transport system permease protein
MLLTGTGLMLKSLWVIRKETAAFAPDRVITTTLSARRVMTDVDTDRYIGDLVGRIESIPGVRASAVGNWTVGPLRVAGMPTSPSDQTSVKYIHVTPHYPAALGLRLIGGRWLEETDREGSPCAAVVNESVAKWYAGQFPGSGHIIGRRIGSQGGCTVVGVVSDLRSRPDSDSEPQAFVSYRQFSLNGGGSLYVRAGADAMKLTGAIQKMIHETPGVSITKIRTLEDQLSDAIAPRRFQAVLLVAFAALALLMAIVGTYGVLSYGVSERTREIGIRMALGAGSADALRLVMRHAMVLAGAGIAAGLIMSWSLTRWVSSLLYGVSPGDPMTYAVVCLLLMGVALLAAYAPARRATRVDPIETLRYE